jgi:PAS domain S-box-containing protein
VVSDPSKPDNPLVFVSRAFCALTGWEAEEIVGRNCRFLQGPDTKPADVARIRELIVAEDEGIVRLLNYTKDGRAFVNTFLLVPLKDASSKKTRLFLGCQCEDAPMGVMEPELPSPQVVPSRLLVSCPPLPTQAPPNEKPLPFETAYATGQVLVKVCACVSCRYFKCCCCVCFLNFFSKDAN